MRNITVILEIIFLRRELQGMYISTVRAWGCHFWDQVKSPSHARNLVFGSTRAFVRAAGQFPRIFDAAKVGPFAAAKLTVTFNLNLVLKRPPFVFQINVGPPLKTWAEIRIPENVNPSANSMPFDSFFQCNNFTI